MSYCHAQPVRSHIKLAHVAHPRSDAALALLIILNTLQVRWPLCWLWQAPLLAPKVTSNGFSFGCSVLYLYHLLAAASAMADSDVDSEAWWLLEFCLIKPARQHV